METYTKWRANQKYIAGNEEHKIFNYNQAIQLYSEAIDLNSDFPQYYVQRGCVRFNQLDFKLAIQDARQATLLNESYIEGYILTINCSIALGDVAAASEAIIRLTELGLTKQVDLASEQMELNKLKQLLHNYDTFFNEKNYDSCLSVMAEAIQISPGALHFQLRRAECMLRKKRFTEAVNIAQSVIKLDSLSAEAHYTLGQIYFHRDMPDEAMKSLECSLQNDQEYKKAKTLRGLIKQILEYKMQANNFFKVGKYEEALVVYLNILELDIKDNDEVTSKMWYNCALMDSNLRNFREAIVNCNAALQINPKYYKAFWMRAKCHFYLEGYDYCLRDCIEAYNIEMTPKVMDLFNKTLKHSSNSLVNDPGANEAFREWNDLYQNGLYTEAIKVCSEAIMLSPMNKKFYEHRIECVIKSGNYQLALKDLATLTLIDNHNESRKLLKLKCLISKGDLDEANTIIQDALRSDNQPKDEYVMLNEQLSTALKVHELFKNKNFKSCLDSLRTLCVAFDMNPLSTTFKLMKAECLCNTGSYVESKVILNEVLEADPKNSKASHLKGLISFNKRMLDEAITHFTQCLECNSEIVEAQIMLQKSMEVKAKIELGARLYQADYYEHANTVYKELLATLGSNDKNIRSSVLHQQAQCAFASGKYDICIEDCLQILEMTESRSVQTLLDSAREKLLTTRRTVIKETRIKENEKLKIKEGLKYLHTSNYKQARECFTDAIEMNSDNAQSYAYRAECYMHLKLYELAIADAEYSTKIDPNSSKGYLLTAKCYLIMGDIFRADVTLQRIQKLIIVVPVIETIMADLRALEASVINATKFFNNMNYRECFEEIDIALKIAHASDHFRMIKVECLVWLGEYDDAQCILKSLSPSNEKYYIEGMISYMKNNLLNASKHLNRCIENDPGHKSAKRLLSNMITFKTQIDRGNELMEMGKFDDALNIFTEAMHVDKKNNVVNSELHFKCAECNYKLGYLKECLNECNSALKLVPGLREAAKLQDQCKTKIEKNEKDKKIANEAAMHIRNGDDFKMEESWERALASYTRAIDLKPDKASFYAKRAECKYKLGDLKECSRDCEIALELFPDFQEATALRDKCKTEIKIEVEKNISKEAAIHIVNGDKFKNIENWQDAIVSYTKAIDMMPERASYYAKRAECHLVFGSFHSSLIDTRKSTELDKYFIDGYIWEAKCLIKMGKTETELKIFQQLENMVKMATGEFEQKKEISVIREICSSYKEGKFADCIKQIDTALEYFPNSLYYKIKQTKCLIRLFKLNKASENIRQLEASKCSQSTNISLLKGLLSYYKDDYEEAEDNLTVYNNHNKDEEAEKLIKRCKILQNIKAYISVNDRKSGLQKFNSEFENYSVAKRDSDIRMRLLYQRALFKHKSGDKKSAFEDCSSALKENPKYENAKKLILILQKKSGRSDDRLEENGKENGRASISSAESAEELCEQDSTPTTIITTTNYITCNCCLKLNIINNIKSIRECLKCW